MSVAARALLPLLLAAGCLNPEPRRMEPRGIPAAVAGPEAAATPGRTGHEISVGGELVTIGAPVVLWYDPGGYSAYRTRPHFSDVGPVGLRYRPGRGTAAASPEEALAEVDQLVLHYDVCGVSRECFRVLHDQRELSVHFLLDVDGTIYQTLDVKDTAWHARQANGRSVGVEIANIGAYPEEDAGALGLWYAVDERGVRLDPPASVGDGGVRTPGFVARPVRPAPVRGRVHGRYLLQYDFTREQYASLVSLAAGLCRALPELPARIPRGPDGELLRRALKPAEFEAFRGILGHFHVSVDKVDPGPAFQWEPFLADVRAARTAPAP